MPPSRPDQAADEWADLDDGPQQQRSDDDEILDVLIVEDMI
jgi:hypothetical protein